MMNIQELKKIMESKNITMYKLSKLSGIENKSVWNIVNGKRKDPQVSTIVKIAKALELNEQEFAELCGYEGNKKSCTPLDIREENIDRNNYEWKIKKIF